MYTRINSRRTPSMIIRTELQWDIAPDKASLWIKDAANPQLIGTVRHAVHVQRNPALGPPSIQIITPDDDLVELAPIPKSKTELVSELPWTYRVFIVRVDLPVL